MRKDDYTQRQANMLSGHCGISITHQFHNEGHSFIPVRTKRHLWRGIKTIATAVDLVFILPQIVHAWSTPALRPAPQSPTAKNLGISRLVGTCPLGAHHVINSFGICNGTSRLGTPHVLKKGGGTSLGNIILFATSRKCE